MFERSIVRQRSRFIETFDRHRWWNFLDGFWRCIRFIELERYSKIQNIFLDSFSRGFDFNMLFSVLHHQNLMIEKSSRDISFLSDTFTLFSSLCISYRTAKVFNSRIWSPKNFFWKSSLALCTAQFPYATKLAPKWNSSIIQNFNFKGTSIVQVLSKTENSNLKLNQELLWVLLVSFWCRFQF